MTIFAKTAIELKRELEEVDASIVVAKRHRDRTRIQLKHVQDLVDVLWQRRAMLMRQIAEGGRE